MAINLTYSLGCSRLKHYSFVLLYVASPRRLAVTVFLGLARLYWDGPQLRAQRLLLLLSLAPIDGLDFGLPTVSDCGSANCSEGTEFNYLFDWAVCYCPSLGFANSRGGCFGS